MANQHSDTSAVDAERAAAWDACRNYAEAARQLGCSRAAVQDSVRRVYGGPVPTPGFAINRLTTARNADDEVTGTYTQERPDKGDTRADPLPGFAIARRTVHRIGGEVAQVWEQEKPEARHQQEAMRAVALAIASDLSRLEPIPAPATSNAKLLNLYTLTDCHVGMLAWHREGGQDWDLQIAERVLFGCFAAMIERSPPASACIVNQLGDFLHYDGLSAITPTSGHVLDADGRFQKMVEVAVRLLRRIVDLALTKHQTVHVIMAEGNHDLASSVWLRVMFKALYENEPRVTVDDSALPYYAYAHGDIMLAFAHGHLKKPAGLPMLFATRFAEMWGRAKKRYGHSGHEHHAWSLQADGMTWRKHPTMAAPDAYSARGGWHSEQAATSFTYHADFGEWGSQSVYPEMLEMAA